jgi:hypothetical protein
MANKTPYLVGPTTPQETHIPGYSDVIPPGRAGGEGPRATPIEDKGRMQIISKASPVVPPGVVARAERGERAGAVTLRLHDSASPEP